jgi:hypothetical protein
MTSSRELPMSPADSTPAALIAYQDAAHLQLARSYCESRHPSLCSRGRTNATAWKFEMLAKPGLAAIAAEEAQSARLVVIAAAGIGELPAPVKAWIESWCASNTPASATLAVVLSENPASPPSRWPDVRFLKSQAARGPRRLVIHVAGHRFLDESDFSSFGQTKNFAHLSR